MKVLIVGAGAVGTCYGHLMAAGGAKVSYYVRPRYAEEVRAGLTAFDLNSSKPDQAHTVMPEHVLGDPEDLRQHAFDQVWLTMSSTALKSGWLDPFVAGIGEATLVMLQPGLVDRQFVTKHYPADRVVGGLITVIAWQTPLPGEEREQAGVAYYFPPMASTPYSGPDARIEAVLRAFSASGRKVKRVDNVAADAAQASAVLMPVIASLECAGWSFAGLRRSPFRRLGTRAAHQCIAIAARFHDRPAKKPLKLVGPTMIGLATRLAPVLMPFDIERYLKYHFSKVGDQTEAALRLYIDKGPGFSLATDHIEELLTAVLASRAKEQAE